MMRIRFTTLVPLACVVLFMTGMAGPVKADIAVVVHYDNPIENLAANELSNVYLGVTTSLSNREEIVLFELSRCSEQFYDQLLGMSPLRFKKHWMRLVFSGAYANPPDRKGTTEEFVTSLCKIKNGIGFIEADSVPECLKIIAIDSLYPGDDGYPFQSETQCDEE